MSTAPDVSTFKQWTAVQFAEYMKGQGLGAYAEAIVKNDIAGDTAPRLTEEDLKVCLSVCVCKMFIVLGDCHKKTR